MRHAPLRRRLVINADDFGASPGANAAILRAHRDGVLTTASLMVNGPAAEEAVRIARAHPRLGVGLHLAFVCGTAALSARENPGLADEQGELDPNPVRAGFRYFVHRGLKDALRREMAAQFDRFSRTGLVLDHVNGHCNFHLHPTVFGLLDEMLTERGVRAVRVTDDPLGIDMAIGSGPYGYRLSHAFIFRRLSARARPVLAARGVACTDRVFGLLQNDRISEDYILRLLDRLPAGDSELYAHPDEAAHAHETSALCSPRVRDRLQQLGIELIRYQDLTSPLFSS